MKSKARHTVVVAATLLCSVAQSVCAAPPVEDAPNPKVTVVTPQTDALRAVTPQADADVNRAAEAARRDQDPVLNGTAKDVTAASKKKQP